MLPQLFQLLLERISPFFYYEPVPRLTRSFIMDLLNIIFSKEHTHGIFRVHSELLLLYAIN